MTKNIFKIIDRMPLRIEPKTIHSTQFKNRLFYFLVCLSQDSDNIIREIGTHIGSYQMEWEEEGTE